MLTSKSIVAVVAAVAGVTSAASSTASSSVVPSSSTTPYLTTFYLGNDAIYNGSGCVVEIDSYTGCSGIAVLSGSQNCSAIQGTVSQPLCGNNGSSITADFQGGDRGTHLSYFDQNHALVAYCTLPSDPETMAKCATTD